MLSKEEECGAYAAQDHFKNKLSIDERLAAQQEARQQVQDHRKLLSNMNNEE